MSPELWMDTALWEYVLLVCAASVTLATGLLRQSYRLALGAGMALIGTLGVNLVLGSARVTTLLGIAAYFFLLSGTVAAFASRRKFNQSQ